MKGHQLSACRPIKAHEHDLIRERVHAAIDAAAQDIYNLVLSRAFVDESYGSFFVGLPDEMKDQIKKIIEARAYYGDAIKNGELTSAQLTEIREYARS